jgi:hypothetical protein
VDAIPVHAVSGAPRSGKSAHVARCAELEPESLGLVNVRVKDLPNLVLAPLGCPCCTARVALQVALARLVREHRPARIYIELPEPAHASALRAVLRQWPLSQYVAPGKILEMPARLRAPGSAAQDRPGK